MCPSKEMLSSGHMWRDLLVHPFLRRAGAATVPALLLFLASCGTFGSTVGATAFAETFVLELSGSRLAAPRPAEYAYFGASLAIRDDTLVVGAWGEGDAGSNAGAVYVFERDGENWAYQSRLTASDASPGARFGHSVAMDADTVLVGAPYDSEGGFRVGAAYVFERDGTAWTEVDKILPVNAIDDMHFGSALDVDTGTSIIGASGPGAPSAHVFVRSAEGWRQQAVFTPTEPDTRAHYGSSVGIHRGTAVVGAWTDTHDDGEALLPSGGEVYVFERSGESWLEADRLRIAGAEMFGVAVAVDAETIAVGAPGAREAVYVFRRTDAGWLLGQEIQAGSGSVEHFGVALALTTDHLVIGAPGHDRRTGTAYVYARDQDGWIKESRIVAPGTPEGLQLGGAVASDAGTIVLGATGDESDGVASGAAYAHR